MAHRPPFGGTQPGSSRRHGHATGPGANFGHGHALAGQWSSPTLPYDLEGINLSEEPTPDALNPGIYSGAEPDEECLLDPRDYGEESWNPVTPLLEWMENLGGLTPEMAAYSNYSYAPTMSMFVEVEPISRNQDPHRVQGYSREQPSNSAEVPINTVDTYNAGVACQPVPATKRPGVFGTRLYGPDSAQPKDPPLVSNIPRHPWDPLLWVPENPYPQLASPANRTFLIGSLELEASNNSPQHLSYPVVRPLTPENTLTQPQPPGILDGDFDLPGTGCFHMNPDQDVVQPRKKRRSTYAEKQRTNDVRKAKACSGCKRSKRKCMHVALGDGTVNATQSQVESSTSVGMPNVLHDACNGTPELLTTIEDSQEASPNGDCPDPRTPASPDSGFVQVADPSQGINTHTLANLVEGTLWVQSLPSLFTDHELNPIQRW